MTTTKTFDLLAAVFVADEDALDLDVVCGYLLNQPRSIPSFVHTLNAKGGEAAMARFTNVFDAYCALVNSAEVKARVAAHGHLPEWSDVSYRDAYGPYRLAR